MNDKSHGFSNYFANPDERLKNKKVVIDGENFVTYNDIFSLSFEIAKNFDFKEKITIALVMNKSIDMIISILSVMFANHAFVPINPRLDSDKISEILKHSNSSLAITDSHNIEKILGIESDIGIYKITGGQVSCVKNNSNFYPVEVDDLAYILYTSGSTGKPKAVAQSFKNLYSHIQNYINSINISSDDKLSFIPDYFFDAGIMDIFASILSGAELHIFDLHKENSILKIPDLIKGHNLTIVHLVPTIFRIFSSGGFDIEYFKSVRCLVFGGEELAKRDVDVFYKLFDERAILVNGYGPTECTTAFQYFIDSKNKRSFSKIPVGKPFSNIKFQIINKDEYGIGEVVIQSENLALCYWKDEKLTNGRFFISDKNELRSYKTGDLGYIGKDEELYITGRTGSEVKINGVMIDLGYIESEIRNLDGIRDCSVVYSGDINKSIIAYIIPEDIQSSVGNLISKIDGVCSVYNIKQDFLLILENSISEKLPSSLLPSKIYCIDKFPLTETGKLKKSCLTKLELNLEVFDSLHPPEDQIEQKIYKIWCDVIGCNKKTGVLADFTKVGGDSVKALIICSKIRAILNVQINSDKLYSLKNVRGLYNYIRSLNLNDYKDSSALEYSIDERNKKYDLTSLQLGFIHSYLINDEKTDSYVVQYHWSYDRKIDPELFEKSWHDIIKKYPALLFEFSYSPSLKQNISKIISFRIEYYDLSKVDDSSVKIEEIRLNDRRRFYDIKKAALFRVYLIKESDNKFSCIFSFYHIILDGWSFQIIFKDLHYFYSLREKNIEVKVVRDRSYEMFLQNYQKNMAKSIDYWSPYANECEDKLDFSGILKDEKISTNLREIRDVISEDKISYNFEASEIEQIKSFTGKTQLRLPSLFLFTWHLLLKLYGRSEETTAGLTISGRNNCDIDVINSVGLFINTLPTRLKIDENRPILELVKLSQDQIDLANTYGCINLSDIKGSRTSERIFETLFVYENFPRFTKVSMNEFNVKSISYFEKLDYPLSMIVDDYSDNINISINYASELFSKDTIQTLLDSYKFLLSQIISNPNTCLRNIKLAPYELAKCFSSESLAFKEIDKYARFFLSIDEVFKKASSDFSTKVAIKNDKDTYTYKELDLITQNLASELQKRYRIVREDKVMLLLKRGIDQVVSILSVLKTGAAFVPVEINSPEKRQDFIISEAKPGLIITNDSEVFKRLKTSELSVMFLDKEVYNVISEDSKTEHNFNKQTREGRDLAYIIYTSGTTGAPKGVMQTHENVIRLFSETDRIFDFGSDDVWVLFHSYSFDFSIWEIFGALFHGATLTIPSEDEIKDLELFYNFFELNKVTILNLTPSVFYQFSDILLLNKQKVNFIKYVIFGGERLDFRRLQRWIENFSDKNPELINMYGITETTVHVTFKKISKSTPYYFSDIGRSLLDMNLHILDKNLNQVPDNIIGELFVSGEGLARGYINSANITAQKFIASPFSVGQRMYRTGDLVRIRNGKILEYISREDSQVKIRGYRIDLKEIERAILSIDGIDQAVVTVRENILNKQLVAYYTSSNSIKDEDVRNVLSSFLPEYMIPVWFKNVEYFPVNQNGKIDIKKLNSESFDSIKSSHNKPASIIENTLVKIISEITGFDKEKINVTESIFSLGIDSIISIKIVASIRKLLGLNISVKDLYNYKTIRAISNNIDLLNKVIALNQVELGRLTGTFNLLPIQKWFFDSKFTKPNHWNQSFVVKVPILDIEKLRIATKNLVEFHDAFGLSFTNHSQIYSSSQKQFEFKVLDISSVNDLSSYLTTIQSKFDLSKGLTYEICYIYGFRDGFARIFFAVHHLIIDSVSWRVIVDDLFNLYKNNKLPEKRTSYRQWVNSLDAYAKANYSQKIFWDDLLKNYYPNYLDNFLVEKKRDKSIEFIIERQQTEDLLYNVNKVFGTKIDDILLSAIALSLNKITNYKEFYITYEGHGREDIDPSVDISRTIGWFTTFVPIKLEVKETIFDTIISIKEFLRKIPDKGIGYGAICGYHKSKLPKIYFNYLGQIDSSPNDSDSWNICDEERGINIAEENLDNSLMTIDAKIIGKELKFSLSNNFIISKEFADTLKSELTNIINYLNSTDKSYLTESDIRYIVDQKTIDYLQSINEIEYILAANSLQQGFIYHYLKDQNSIEYLVELEIDYEKNIDVDKYKNSWQSALETFPALRLRFDWEDKFLQIIDKKSDLNFEYHDFTKIPDVQEAIEKIKSSLHSRQFKLEKGNLFKVILLKITTTKFKAIFQNHHAILDGWSHQILLDYVHKKYLKLEKSDDEDIEQNDNYVNCQQLIHDNEIKNEKYWNDFIDVMKENQGEGFKLFDISKRSKLYKDEKLIIASNNLSKLRDISRANGVTINSALQYFVHKILNLQTASNHTVVGATVSGRNINAKNIMESVGLFINTLPLYFEHNDEDKILDSILKLQNRIYEINENSSYSLVKLTRGGHALFDVVVIYENYPHLNSSLESINGKFSEYKEQIDYPLVVMVTEDANQLIIKLKFDSGCCSKAYTDNFKYLLNLLIEQFISNPDQYFYELKFSDVTQEKIITQYSNISFLSLFEKQVQKTPLNIAIISGKKKITYCDLNQEVEKLAKFIKLLSNNYNNKHVLLYLERNEKMLISILAAQKVGCAYVPIDINTPRERLSAILDEVKPAVIISNKNNFSRLNFFEYIHNIIYVDDEFADRQDMSLTYENQSDDLIYIAYTSGSTGVPKGVMISHGAFINTILNIKDLYFTDKDVISTHSSTGYSFDIFGLEYALPLITGGFIALSNYENLEVDCSNLSFIQMTPSICQIKLENLYNTKNCILFIGAESLQKNLLDRALKYFDKVINFYGPTETTIWSTSKEYNSSKQYDLVTIGSALPGEVAYIINDKMQILPEFSIGKLYIGGNTIARGYYKNIELTQKSFLPNIYLDSGKIYKTDDIVRRLPNGEFEFLGRKDSQVKINGNRVELAEIEILACRLNGVEQAAVKLFENEMLVLFITSTENISKDYVLSYLSLRLPNYMIPSLVVHIDKLPLNKNGKIDKNLLKMPEVQNQQTYLSPRSDLEIEIMKIFSSVLKYNSEKLGLYDNFFRIGGNSLLIIKLLNDLNTKFRSRLVLQDILENPSIYSIAQILEKEFETDNQQESQEWVF